VIILLLKKGYKKIDQLMELSHLLLIVAADPSVPFTFFPLAVLLDALGGHVHSFAVLFAI